MNTEPTLPPDGIEAYASRENVPASYTNEDGSIDWTRLVADKGVPPVTIRDGSTGTMKAPPPLPGAVNAPYIVNPNVTYKPVSVEQLQGPAPFATYLEYLSTIKAVYVALKANGTHKQAGIALALLWVICCTTLGTLSIMLLGVIR